MKPKLMKNIEWVGNPPNCTIDCNSLNGFYTPTGARDKNGIGGLPCVKGVKHQCELNYNRIRNHPTFKDLLNEETTIGANNINNSKIRLYVFGNGPNCADAPDQVREYKNIVPLETRKCFGNDCCAFGEKVIGMDIEDIVAYRNFDEKISNINKLHDKYMRKVLGNYNANNKMDAIRQDLKLMHAISSDYIPGRLNEGLKINNMVKNNFDDYKEKLFEPEPLSYPSKEVRGYNDYFINILSLLSARDEMQDLKIKRYLEYLENKGTQLSRFERMMKEKITELSDDIKRNKDDARYNIIYDIMSIISNLGYDPVNYPRTKEELYEHIESVFDEMIEKYRRNDFDRKLYYGAVNDMQMSQDKYSRKGSVFQDARTFGTKKTLEDYERSRKDAYALGKFMTNMRVLDSVKHDIGQYD